MSSMVACVSVNRTSRHCCAMSCRDSRLDRIAGLATAGIWICLFVLVGICIISLCVAGRVVFVVVSVRIICRSGFMCDVGWLTCDRYAPESRAYCLPSQVTLSVACCAAELSSSSCVLAMYPVVGVDS